MLARQNLERQVLARVPNLIDLTRLREKKSGVFVLYPNAQDSRRHAQRFLALG